MGPATKRANSSRVTCSEAANSAPAERAVSIGIAKVSPRRAPRLVTRSASTARCTAAWRSRSSTNAITLSEMPTMSTSAIGVHGRSPRAGVARPTDIGRAPTAAPTG
jgi:hypothetical protein